MPSGQVAYNAEPRGLPITDFTTWTGRGSVMDRTRASSMNSRARREQNNPLMNAPLVESNGPILSPITARDVSVLPDVGNLRTGSISPHNSQQHHVPQQVQRVEPPLRLHGRLSFHSSPSAEAGILPLPDIRLPDVGRRVQPVAQTELTKDYSPTTEEEARHDTEDVVLVPSPLESSSSREGPLLGEPVAYSAGWSIASIAHSRASVVPHIPPPLSQTAPLSSSRGLCHRVVARKRMVAAVPLTAPRLRSQSRPPLQEPLVRRTACLPQQLHRPPTRPSSCLAPHTAFPVPHGSRILQRK